MNRKKVVDDIIELMARFRAEVEACNSVNLYDINIHGENVIIPILNKIYGLKLVNANYEEKNTSAIDLIDRENKIAIQVTSTANIDKIKHTLEQYVKYKKNEEFDRLIIYILTKRQKSYSIDSINKIINNQFEFSIDNDILDYENLLKEISSWISLSKLQELLNLLQAEFSDEKISQRRYILENKDKFVHEVIYPNILEVKLPEILYVGKLSVDRDEVIKKSWETEYRLKKSASEKKVVGRAFEFMGIPNVKDWHVFEGSIISFKPLNETSEPLSRLAEAGTVEEYNTTEFPSNFKYENALSQLIDNCLQEMLSYKFIQWLRKERMFRFRPIGIARERKIQWKNKKMATRSVVTEVWNKEKTQITHFRQMSFKIQSFMSENRWYIAVTPTWSFTYNGYQSHKQESKLITDKKMLEKNSAVYQHFMFISYCLMNKIVDNETNYPWISFSDPFRLNLSYKVEYGY